MDSVILLDTHVVVWLYAGLVDQLSTRARRVIDESNVAISPVVELELAYLHEIGRITESAPSIVGDLAMRIGMQVAQIQFAHVCAEAVGMTWTRDPFDRLQAAHAQAARLQLLTKDAQIREHLELAVWD